MGDNDCAGEAGGPTHVLSPAPPIPVGLPDVDGVLIGDAVLLGLLIQQVKEVLHSQRHRAAGAENHLEQVVHKLLQCALGEEKEAESPVRMEILASASLSQLLMALPCASPTLPRYLMGGHSS